MVTATASAWHPRSRPRRHERGQSHPYLSVAAGCNQASVDGLTLAPEVLLLHGDERWRLIAGERDPYAWVRERHDPDVRLEFTEWPDPAWAGWHVLVLTSRAAALGVLRHEGTRSHLTRRAGRRVPSGWWSGHPAVGDDTAPPASR